MFFQILLKEIIMSINKIKHIVNTIKIKNSFYLGVGDSNFRKFRKKSINPSKKYKRAKVLISSTSSDDSD